MEYRHGVKWSVQHLCSLDYGASVFLHRCILGHLGQAQNSWAAAWAHTAWAMLIPENATSRRTAGCSDLQKRCEHAKQQVKDPSYTRPCYADWVKHPGKLPLFGVMLPLENRILTESNP